METFLSIQSTFIEFNPKRIELLNMYFVIHFGSLSLKTNLHVGLFFQLKCVSINLCNILSLKMTYAHKSKLYSKCIVSCLESKHE